MSDIQKAALRARASFAQERMWFLEQLEGEAAAYNQLNTLLIKGPLDVELLKRSLDEVVSRHEALRTTLRFVDGELFQYVSEPRPMDLPFRDLSGMGNALEEAERLSVAGVKKRFDLSADSVIGASLFKIAADLHFLAFITHHVAFDGWSITILVDELSAIYEALHHGSPLPPPPAVQYADYAVWQRERFRSGELQEQLEYWKERLKGELPVLELPLDHARPAVQSFEGDVIERTIPSPVIDALREAARGERATLFMALLAAYGAFLFRHTGQEDIIIGCPIAGRTRVELEKSIGLFVNTLPIRLRVNGDTTFRELLRETRKAAFEAYERQDMPFEKIVESLQVARQPSTTPVLQTMFQLRNYPVWKMSRDGLEWDRYDARYNTAKFDLTLETTDTASGLYCRFEYPPALFDPETIGRMAEHWELFLRGIVSDPGQYIGRIPLISGEEARRAIIEWNDTKSPYPELPAHRIFEARAAESPNAIAIVHGDERITYGDLNARANRLARYLGERGMQPGMAVVICMERSVGLVAAELAVLKAGCAFTPIDPSYPPERIRFIADDVDARVILTGDITGIEGIEPARLACLREASLDRYEAGDLPDAAGIDATAYVIYTSGSTGRPKGVGISHRGIVRLVVNMNYASVRPGDGVSFTSNPTFDVSIFDIWSALLNGARLVIFDKETLLSPADFAALAEREKVSVLTLTTQLFNLYSQEVPGMFRLIRDVYFAGEAADPPSVRRVLANGPPGRLVNAYGPTENAVYSTWYEVREPPGGSVPIGRPISNSTAYVLDAYLQPLPIGVHGEIFVGGDGVGQGYHRRPDLTAAAFIPDPFAGGSARLYKTGDIGRYLPDGNIQYIGRRDGQVKIRGFRVEPGEIRAALESHPSIKEAFIVAGPDGSGKRLVAYVRGDVETGELRQFLKGRLPDYMVPSAFVTVDAFPTTPNGKIDVRAFPKPEAGRKASAEPSGGLEMSLAAIWDEVLGVGHIGALDDFFDLGGHSLAAIRLFAKIEERLSVRLPVNTIFLAPTVSQLAAAIREKPNVQRSLVLMRKGSVRPPLFCISTIVGTLLEYEKLFSEFREDREVYGLQKPKGDGARPPPSVEELAALYIREIKTVQPKGPYHLLGYCAAGAIAYEMARQLKDAGDEVAFLGFTELMPPPHSYRPGLDSAISLSGRAALALSNIVFAPPGKRIKRIMSLSEAFRLRKIQNGTAPVQYPDWVGSLPKSLVEDTRDNYVRHRQYTIKTYAGDLTVFFSMATRDSIIDKAYYSPQMGWERIVKGKVYSYFIPGDHHTLTQQPNVRELARAVEECLMKASGRGGVL